MDFNCETSIGLRGKDYSVGAFGDGGRDRSFYQNEIKETRRLISKADGRLMLVTHQVNISALTGQTTRSGEVLVIRVVDGEVEVLRRVLIDP